MQTSNGGQISSATKWSALQNQPLFAEAEGVVESYWLKWAERTGESDQRVDTEPFLDNIRSKPYRWKLDGLC